MKKKTSTTYKAGNGIKSVVSRRKNRASQKNDYPHWAYPSKKDWLRDVRKRWAKFRRMQGEQSIMSGCAFYPKEVYRWLYDFRQEMDRMNKLMRDYYKGA